MVLKQSFTDLNQGLNKCDCLLGSVLRSSITLCSFHLPRASLNDTEGAKSPSSLQETSWDKLDIAQWPAVSCIRASGPVVVTLHMCSCLSTETGWLLSHGFCWISYLSVSWHQLFQWAPNLLPSDHWRQPEHISTQLLQQEDADSKPTQPGGNRSSMGQTHPKCISHHTEVSLQELLVLSLTNQTKRGFVPKACSVHGPMKGFLKVSALSALQFNVRDACQAEDLPALQRRAHNNTRLISPRDYNCTSRKQTTGGSKWGAIQKDYSGIPCSRSHH